MAMSQRMWKHEQERRRRERLKRARRRRNCAIAVFVAAAAAVLIIVSKSCDDSSAPMPDSSAPTEEAVTMAPVPEQPFKASVEPDEIDLSSFENSVFVGNAVAENIALYNMLSETDFYSSVNLDLENVYTTASGYDSMSASDQLKSKRFSRVFLCFGERELEWNDATEFATAYRKFIDKVKEYQPSASIYVISIPPVTKMASDSNAYGVNMKKIKEYNRFIRNMAYSEKLYYVDSVAALGGSSGYLSAGSSADGINLNREYVIELLSYIDESAYIPNTPATDEDEDKDEEERETESPKPEKTPAATDSPEPEPTINVLKDSAIKDNN